MSKKLRDVMNTELVELDAEISAVDGAKQMRDRGIGNVLVTEKDELRGIVTDRDLVVRCLADGQDPKTTRLGQLCSLDLVTLPEDSTVGDAVKMMSERGVRRVPVVKGKKAVGIVSLGDLALSQDKNSALGQISAAQPNS
jgi:signal-transduction protein with cAMP-binding, CBS, and nucleotidyltransferase domain